MVNELNCGDYLEKDMIIIEKFGGSENSSFGIVYLVYIESKNIIIALKTLQEIWLSEEDILNEFKKEIVILTELNHPNIIKTVGVDFIDNQPYMMMEPIIPINNKVSLNDYFGLLSLDKILNWAIQFCHGMEYLNDNGIVAHCDIKPDNILIQMDIVKISDFGLIELNNKFNFSNLRYKGTFAYMAPEAFKNVYNVQSDIYSFGIVLYQLVNNGELPFYIDSSDFRDWEELHKNQKILPFNSVLYSIISKCLEKDPNKRYCSFYRLRKDFEDLCKKFSFDIYVPNLIDENVQEYFGKAHTFAKYKMVDNAKLWFDRIFNLDEVPLDILINSGIDLLEINEYDYSIKFLNRCFKYDLNDENKSKIYFNIGHAYHLKNNLNIALKYYNKSLAFNDENLKVYVNMGNIYKDFQDYNKSLAYYDHVLYHNRNCWQAIINKAITFSLLGDFQNSDIYFEKSLGFNEDEKVYIEWGLSFRRQDKEVQAMLKFDNAIKINNNSSFAHYNMILSYLIQGKSDFASNYYNDFKFLFDYTQKIIIAYDFAHYESFDIINDITIDILQNCNDLFLKSDAYAIKITCANSIDEAEEYYNKSLELNPNNIRPYEKLGVFYRKNNLLWNSLDIFKLGLEVNKNDISLLRNISGVYFQLGDFNSSKEYLLKWNDYYHDEESYLRLIVFELSFNNIMEANILFNEAKNKNLFDNLNNFEEFCAMSFSNNSIF